MSRPGFPVDMNESITVQNHYFDASPPGSVTDGTDTCFYRKVFEDKSGDNTPGWPEHVQTNSYIRSKFTWQQTPLTVDGTVSGGDHDGDTFYGQWGNAFGLDYYPWASFGEFNLSDARSDLEYYLIGKLIDKIQRNRVNLGEVFHTRAQAGQMVGDACTRIALAFNRVKRGDIKGALNAFGLGRRAFRGGGKPPPKGLGVAENWLALRYGWLPLLSDCYNSVQVVHRAWTDKGNAITVKATGERRRHRHVRTLRAQPHGPLLQWVSNEGKVSGKASVTFAVANQLNHSLTQLGLRNPLSLAWELLPLSFVVDWALPIGNYLSSLDYTTGLEFKYGYISYKHQDEVTLSLADSHGQLDYGGGVANASWSGGSGHGTAFVFERNALSGFPSPPIPRLKDPFSPIHMANGLSLLAVAFGR